MYYLYIVYNYLHAVFHPTQCPSIQLNAVKKKKNRNEKKQKLSKIKNHSSSSEV